MALTQQQISQLTRATTQLRTEIRKETLDIALNLWDGLPDYRSPNVKRFVKSVEPAVRGAQQLTTQITDAYIAATTDGKPSKLIDVRDLRDGLPFDEEYERPATTLYTDLSEGKPLSEAQRHARQRLFYLVVTDIQLAYTNQVHYSLDGKMVHGWRRVVGSNKSCALCLIASTRLYYKSDLMPIHPGCQCSVEPWKGERGVDVDSANAVIDHDTLWSVHNAIQQEFGATDWNARDLGPGAGKVNARGKRVSDYTDLMVVRNHGEYGPTLAWRGDRFTGPKNLKYKGT